LKFAVTFTQKLEYQNTAATGSHEGYKSVGDILGIFGRTIDQFAHHTLAIADVQYLVKRNAAEFSWIEAEHPAKMDSDKPIYSSFWWVSDLGKKNQQIQKEIKTLAGEAEVKNLAALDQTMGFMEGIGLGVLAPPETAITIANAHYAELGKKVANLKSTYLHSIVDSQHGTLSMQSRLC
jgi:hypothetical protein